MVAARVPRSICIIPCCVVGCPGQANRLRPSSVSPSSMPHEASGSPFACPTASSVRRNWEAMVTLTEPRSKPHCATETVAIRSGTMLRTAQWMIACWKWMADQWLMGTPAIPSLLCWRLASWDIISGIVPVPRTSCPLNVTNWSETPINVTCVSTSHWSILPKLF